MPVLKPKKRSRTYRCFKPEIIPVRFSRSIFSLKRIKFATALLIMIVLITLPFLSTKKIQAEETVFYPSNCSGDWKNSETVAGSPDSKDMAKAAAQPDGSNQEIICKNFTGELPPDVTIINSELEFVWSNNKKLDVPIKEVPIDQSFDNATTPDTNVDQASPQTNLDIPKDNASSDTKSDPSVPAADPTQGTLAPESAPAPDSSSTPSVESAPATLPSSSALPKWFNNFFIPTVLAQDNNTDQSTNLFDVKYGLSEDNWQTVGQLTRENLNNRFPVSVSNTNLSLLKVSVTSKMTIDSVDDVSLQAVRLIIKYGNNNSPTVTVKDSNSILSGKEDYKPNEQVSFTINNPNLEINDVKNLVDQGKVEVVDDKKGILGKIVDSTTTDTPDKKIDTTNNSTPQIEPTSTITPEIKPDINPSGTLPQSPDVTPTSSVGPLSLLKRLFFPIPTLAQINEIGATVLDANGDATNIIVQIATVSVNGQDTKQININKPERNFKPGKYTLQVTIPTTDATIISKQDFTWGVLALNTNKTIYQGGETAFIQMGVLNDGGHTICNADLNLDITSPQGGLSHFSTNDGSIIRAKECGPDNIIDVPDYSTNFSVPNETGNYSITLTAQTTNGSRTVTDNFEVTETTPFVVERIGPTRIYPVATYPMNLKITAQAAWQGTVIEKVPASFEITQPENSTNYDSVTIDNQTKIISWNISLTAGQEINLGYVFKAPEISPEFYLLGKAVLTDLSGIKAFEETRNWQIASDAACNATITGTWGTTDTATFTSCSGAASTGTGTGARPGANDTVTINAGVTITATVNATVTGITMASPTTANGLSVNTGVTLTLTGALVYTANATANAQTITLNGTGSIAAATMTVAAPTSTGSSLVTCAAGATGTLSTTGAMSLSGAATTAGAVTLTMNTCNLTSGGLLTMAGGTTGGLISIIETTGTFTASAGITFTGTATRDVLTLGSGSIFNLSGAMSAGGTPGINTGCTTRTSGTTAINGAYSFGNFNVLSGTTTLGAVAITINGTTSVTGILTNASSATAKTFTGAVTVNSGGSFNLNVATVPVVSFNGGITMAAGATAFNATGATTFTANQSINGAVNMAFGATTINSGVTLTNNSTATVTFASIAIASPTASNGLSLTTGSTTTITGALTFTANAAAGQAQLITMNGTANVSVASITMPATTSTGTAKITCASGATGTLTSSGTVAITGSATTSGGLSSIDFGTVATACNLTTNALTITAGTIGSASVIMGSGTLQTNGLLTLAAAASGTALANVTSAGGIITAKTGITMSGTVIANAQLTTTGSGTVTLTGTMTGNGTINIGSSTTFNTTGTAGIASAVTLPNLNVLAGTTTLGAQIITVTGATNITGALANSTGAQLKTFTGLVTINSSGSVALTTATVPAVTFGGGITTVSGAGSVNFGSGATTIAANQNINGPVAVTIGAVTINSGFTLTNNLAATFTMASLTMPIATAANNLSLTTGTTTTVTGAITYTANTQANPQTITMNGTANLNAGSVVIAAPTSTGGSFITCAGGATGTFTVTGALGITGNSTSTGPVTLGMGTCTLMANGLVTITGGTNTTGEPTISSTTGILDFNAGLTFSGTVANANLTTTSNGTINFTGTMTGAGTLSINSATTFNTTGVTALSSAITLPNLNVLANTTTLGAVAITISGATNITGALANANSATAKTFTGLITINSGGSVALTTGTNPVVNFGAGIDTVSGAGTINFGIGVTTFTANQSLDGPVGITLGAVTINSGVTLTNNMTATVTIASLTMPIATAANNLSLTTGTTTTVTGAITYTANTQANPQTITMNGTANLNAGSVVIAAPTSTGGSFITCAGGATGTFTVTGALGITGNSTSTGPVTLGMGTCTLMANGLVTITGGTNTTGEPTISSTTGILDFNAGLTFSGTVANANLTTTSNGTINFTGTMTGAGTLSINSATMFNGIGTVALNTAGTLGDLTISSGTTTTGAAITLADALIVNDGAILTMGNFALTVTGLTTIGSAGVSAGTINTATGATGTRAFTGDVLIQPTSIWNLSGQNPATSFGGNITMNGLTFNNGFGATTFTASKNLAGSNAMIFGGAVTINNTFTLTNNNTSTVDFNGNINGGGSSANFATGLNSTTRFAGTVMTAGTITPSTSVNTIEYDGGTQTIDTPTTNPYYNLNITTVGVKSLAAATSVSNLINISTGTLDTTSAGHYALNTKDLTIGGSGTLLGQSAVITLTGSWSNSGIFTAATSTVILNGGATVTISGATTFNNLTITHTSAKEVDWQSTASPVFNVVGIFTVTGHTGALIKLYSDVPTVKWRFHPTGTASVDYVDVKDGGCEAGAISINPTNFTNSGNNEFCWSQPSITMSMSLSNPAIGFGTLSMLSPRYATSNTLGSGAETVAHTIDVSTNATYGYTLYIQGNSLIGSGSHVITPIGATPVASNPGNEQFGIRATVSGGSALVNSVYGNISNYGYNATGSLQSIIGSSSSASTDTFSLRYLCNIGFSTNAGSYSTTLTYTAVGGF